MKPIKIVLPGAILKSGFWLYVWIVRMPDGRKALYVGRTGDSSSPNAAPPYRRLGQHLGTVIASNALRTHISNRKVAPESCKDFTFIAYGPLFKKQLNMKAHRPVRDKVAALEKALANFLHESGYDVLNKVNSRMELDPKLWGTVRRVFVRHFPRLGVKGRIDRKMGKAKPKKLNEDPC